MFSTLQLGTVGDWVGGIIAGVALLIAAQTQRRDSIERVRADAQVFRINASFREPGYEGMRKYSLSMQNFADRTIYNVALGIMQTDRTTSDFFTLIDVETATNPDGTPFLPTRDQAYRIAFGDLLSGEHREFDFSMIPAWHSHALVAFTDSKGRDWVRDLPGGQLRRLSNRNAL